MKQRPFLAPAVSIETGRGFRPFVNLDLLYRTIALSYDGETFDRQAWHAEFDKLPALDRTPFLTMMRAEIALWDKRPDLRASAFDRIYQLKKEFTHEAR